MQSELGRRLRFAGCRSVRSSLALHLGIATAAHTSMPPVFLIYLRMELSSHLYIELYFPTYDSVEHQYRDMLC